ncbi:MAG TPA: sigma-70 family RNA polymerase sigma factor [Solirubrobacterales bacterium]|jgi:RNA polymerase sigma-70 factor (ECF subfamily)
MPNPTEQRSLIGPDQESRAWIADLRADGETRERALARLHELLLRATRFEVGRRRRMLPHLRGGDLDDVALQSADDALVAVLRKLEDFRGQSRFTTWAYKFGLLEAAVKLRRLAWQGREIPLEPDHWTRIGDGKPSPHADAERRELLGAVGEAIEVELTPHQREVLVALALNEVPIDVLAERLATTRGALYKTLHDARRKLRRRLETDGHAIGPVREEDGDE